MSEKISAQKEYAFVDESEYVIFIGEGGKQWTTWNHDNLEEFEKSHGVRPKFHNQDDVIYQDSQDHFFYAKIPKPTSDGGIIQLTNELWGNFTYSSVGLVCPPSVFATVDSSGTFRIASSFDLQFSDALQPEDSFDEWSRNGLEQLKGNCVGRVYLHDTDTNISNICFNRTAGFPCFIDFAHSGTGIHGDKFEAASSRLGVHDVNYFGWQLIDNQSDSAVKHFTDRFSNFPIHRLEQHGRKILPLIISKLPLAKKQKEKLWENFDKTIQIHRFRKSNIRPWIYDDLLLKIPERH